MSERVCAAPRCERAWVAKGLCLKHYKAARRPAPPTASERFWRNVKEGDGGCWIWQGTLRVDGYGQFGVGRQRWLAHRFAFVDMVGEIPAHLQLDHLCRVESCVNPDHLEPVTAHVNNMRSNSLAALRARQEHCQRGHEFTPENTYLRPDARGGRMCRTCCELREARRPKRGAA